MTFANVALRAAIHDALSADGALTAALGGQRVYDAPPRGAAFPYVTLGEARLVDASSDGGETQEHLLTLHGLDRGRADPTRLRPRAAVGPSDLGNAARGSGLDQHHVIRRQGARRADHDHDDLHLLRELRGRVVRRRDRARRPHLG